MKEYGTDFQKKYFDIEDQQKKLDAKVRKRAKFLSQQNLPFDTQLKNSEIDNLSTLTLILKICAVEEQYVSQSKQGNLFE